MKLILYLLIAILLNSCVITNTPGFYNGYKKLTIQEKQMIVFSDSKLNQPTNNGQIAVINGTQLRDYAQGIDTLVVYRWSPNCSANVCISISSCQEYCKSNNYKLAVIAEYYDIEIMDAQNVGDLPIFIPNHIYYKRYFANSLNNLFFKDLLNGDELSKNDKYNRFYFFKAGKLIGSRNNLFIKH